MHAAQLAHARSQHSACSLLTFVRSSRARRSEQRISGNIGSTRLKRSRGSSHARMSLMATQGRRGLRPASLLTLPPMLIAISPTTSPSLSQ